MTHAMLAANPEALTVDGAKNLAIGLIVGLLLVGILIALVIKAIIGRIISLVVAVVLAAIVYTQHDSIVNQAENAAKRCDVSFFGAHLTPSDPNVKKACTSVTNR